MTFLHHPPVRCLGVDVAKDSLTVAHDDRAAAVHANSRPAIRSLLRAARPDLVVCEPTGGHELLLLEECLRAGIACHRADTLKLKAFIRSFGTLGKSDAIDAAHIAAYGRERWARLPLWTAPDADARQLQALVRRRSDLVAIRVAERNRSKAPGAKAVAASLRAVLATVERQIKVLDAAIATLAANSRSVSRRIAVCTAMAGIGLVSAATLLAQMPNSARSSAARPPRSQGRLPTPTKAAPQSAGEASEAAGRRSEPPCSCQPSTPPPERANSPPSTDASSTTASSPSSPSVRPCERSS